MPTKSLLINSDVSIDENILSVRAVNALRKLGYKTLSDCLNLSIEDLYKVKNIGRKTANEIIDAINSFKKRYQQAKLIDADPEARLSWEVKYLYWVTVLSLPISVINLSVRTANVLKQTKAHNLLDLVKKKSSKIIRIRNCGKKTLREISDFLRKLELQLGVQLDVNLVQDVISNISHKTEDELISDFKNKYPEKYSICIEAKVNNLDPSRIEFYTNSFRLYLEGGTLEYVAKKLRLTRERIRQILVEGTKLGLFNYTGKDYCYIEKDKIIADYSKYLRLGKVAQVNAITLSYLRRMLTAYKITEKDLGEVRLKSTKDKCIELYRKIETELGRPPTTTDLQKRDGPRKGWRYLSIKIVRIWGSIDAFREELCIPKPIRTWPEASRKWQDNRKRVAFIVRMQNLDQIRDCLAGRSPLASSEIAYACNIKPPKALRLLNLLIARGEIRKQGVGSSIKYRLDNEKEMV